MAPAEALPPEELYRHCDPEQFEFESTAELAPLDGVMGQERAAGQPGQGDDLERPASGLDPTGSRSASVSFSPMRRQPVNSTRRRYALCNEQLAKSVESKRQSALCKSGRLAFWKLLFRTSSCSKETSSASCESKRKLTHNCCA